jgi:hypothetical protein
MTLKLVTIRHAIEHGAARLVGRARIFPRHHALALADEHPGPATIDDLLPMMTLGCGEVRLERVPSAQMIVSPASTPRRPSSQATSRPWRVQACASAGPAFKRRARGYQNREDQGTMGGHAALRWLNRHHDPWSPVTGFRFKAPGPCQPAAADVSNCSYYSIGCGNIAGHFRSPLQKSPGPFKTGRSGEMAEWLKAHAWKACVRETVPWVRIPLSPPLAFASAGWFA